MQQLLTRELAEHVGIGTSDIWHDIRGPITRDEVLNYTGPLLKLDSYDWDYFDADEPEIKRNEHIQRITWLCRNPDKWEPLYLDENTWGIPILEDGHHRLYAALLRNDATVCFNWSGTWQHFRWAFPKSYKRGLFRWKYQGNDLYKDIGCYQATLTKQGPR